MLVSDNLLFEKFNEEFCLLSFANQFLKKEENLFPSLNLDDE
ncbi:hypothetical protein PRV_00380 [Mycoplasma parvum str. Indiana]|uniref:Uncharacterized protein n=1 Tax=Mycoplasma parvum str. Indiana TaxID=1403316 RepID=U5NBD6_9MOLU|nr:hypothetical protein PRV_00380 [Mycoplasma parvum str. Indiana]